MKFTNSLQSLLVTIYIDTRLDIDGENTWATERQEAWMHEIEKELGAEYLELQYERFIKRDADRLHVGAQVKSKSHQFGVGRPGTITKIIWTDDDNYDCIVDFAHIGTFPVRVEQLVWEIDGYEDVV